MSDLIHSERPHVLGKALLVIQWILLIALLSAAQFAMQFTPFEGIYENGVYEALHSVDPLYPQRAGLVASGLGTLCFIAVVAFRRCRQYAAVLFGLALAALVVGWRMYPYWATGVFSVMRNLSPGTDLDPKELIPMSWIGEMWRLPVLLLYLVSFAGIPTLFVTAAIGLKRKAWARTAAIGFCIGVTVLAYVFSPNYGIWLMD